MSRTSLSWSAPPRSSRWSLAISAKPWRRPSFFVVCGLRSSRCGIGLWPAIVVLAFTPLTAAPTPLPEGVKAVWDLAKAAREGTPTRERLSINGLWQWQPAAAETLPKAAWGYLRVPEPWPSGNQRTPSRFFYPHPDWVHTNLRSLTAAWYQREVTVPREWAGRRIALSITEEEKAVLRWESEKFKTGSGWMRWDPPQSLNSQVFDDRFGVISIYT
jgi:hypothetical protein